MVKPVPAETDQPQLVVYFCGRIASDSSMSACSEAGCAPDVGFVVGDPNCNVSCMAICYEGTVPLRSGLTNHITVCQENATCDAGGCVTNDLNGAPLVVQVATPSGTPTATPPASPCGAGDCDSDGRVTIVEIITLVNIAMGSAPSSACPYGIPAGTTVDISLIIEAVNRALNGCGGVAR